MKSVMTPAGLSAALAGDFRNAIVASTPGGIEQQEAAGQAALVASTMMPKEMRPSRAAFEAVGFVFGDEADELFYNATLPPGWTRKATDHAMHSDILDEKGRTRIGIFYKAAFYDRRADSYMTRRYSVRSMYPDHHPEIPPEHVGFAMFDGDVRISEPMVVARRDYDQQVVAEDELVKEMTARFPDWNNPTAYWD